MKIKYLILKEFKQNNSSAYHRSQPILLNPVDDKTFSLSQLSMDRWLLCTINNGNWIFSQSR